MKVRTPEDMRRVGAALGSVLAESMNGALLIGIEGELGAGKTVFVSGVLSALGIAGPVRSPTYTLIEPYECGGLTVYHLDLYRLADPREVEALGVRDLMTDGAALLVEWPERGAGVLPSADLWVSIAYADSMPEAGREVQLCGRTARGQGLARAARDAVKFE